MDDWTPEPEALLEPGNLQPGPADPVLDHWLRFKPLFAAEMAGGFWTIADLEAKVLSKRAFFFPGKNAALIGQIELYPSGERVFQLTFAAGDAAELISMTPGCEAVARMMGCAAMLLEGRPAWRRIMAPHGYELWSMTLHKRL